MNNKAKFKIYISFFFLAVGFVIILIRAFYLQVVARDRLKKYSESQIVRELKVYPNRGNILDRAVTLLQ